MIDFWRTHHSDITREEALANLDDWQTGDGRLYAIIHNGEPVGFLRLHKSSPAV